MDAIVEVTGGKVRGRTVDGVSAYLGIPYAATPVGAARFQAPRPVTAWHDVRDATQLGGTCLQAPYAAVVETILGNYIVAGDDCLNVNVWTPESGATDLPVMVWIHGGGFDRGSNAAPMYDGTAFARDGVVLVSVNYRLGVEGFAVLDGAPANRGLLDQLQALAWVRDNVETFGGNPHNVTIFGESAGAMSIASLLASPLSDGLFAKAILQSGNAAVCATVEDARKVSADMAARLGVEATADAFAAVEPTALIAAQEAFIADFQQAPDPARWGRTIVGAGFGVLPLIPVIDGTVVTGPAIDAIAADAAQSIPVLAGTMTEEFRLFTVPAGLDAVITASVLPALLASRGLAASTADVFAQNRPHATACDLYALIITDLFFRSSTVDLALAQTATGAPAFVYEFDWGTPVLGLGACHGLEIPFVFDTLRAAQGLVGAAPPQRLADEMHAAWIAFAATGDPGWPAYEPDTRVVMSFADPASSVVKDPRSAELAAVRTP